MNDKHFLGIEFGSTRIKAVLIDDNFKCVSSSDYKWVSSFTNGVWTYDLKEAIEGLKTVIRGINSLSNVKSIGISAMMHGYLAFDKDWNLLVPFRTWQNTCTGESSKVLTSLFNFNIPQRWSISHLYQAILNKEEHIKDIAHITTLGGYIHYLLTGVNAVGIGEASGIFPINENILDYNQEMLDSFDKLIEKENLPWKIRDVLPKVLLAGDDAGSLTIEGVSILENRIETGVKFAPCEGDAGTGMVATNAISPKTGNVSAGTSVFSMVVLEKVLNTVYEDIDLVTTPTGKPVAMVHCNNCTNDSNAWFKVFKEVITLFGFDVNDNELYAKLYNLALSGGVNCDDIYFCNYLAGESITHMDKGVPLMLRQPTSEFSLRNVTRSILYSTLVTLKLGMDILVKEGVEINSITGHGGLFKTPVVGQKILSSAINAPVTCLETAGEGGPYGMAILAAYAYDTKDLSLDDYLNKYVFAEVRSSTITATKEEVEGFNKYTEGFKNVLKVEETAIKNL